jgi:hypothetical protein
MSKKYNFVIDTDKYAGNFEREMCAYATGILGDCEVGKNMQKLFIEEEDGPNYGESLIFDNVIEQRPDENGCHRPCATGITPNLDKCEYNSVEIYFHERPSEKQIEILKRRCTKFVENKSFKKRSGEHNYPTKILGFRLVTEETISTEEEI